MMSVGVSLCHTPPGEDATGGDERRGGDAQLRQRGHGSRSDRYRTPVGARVPIAIEHRERDRVRARVGVRVRHDRSAGARSVTETPRSRGEVRPYGQWRDTEGHRSPGRSCGGIEMPWSWGPAKSKPAAGGVDRDLLFLGRHPARREVRRCEPRGRGRRRLGGGRGRPPARRFPVPLDVRAPTGMRGIKPSSSRSSAGDPTT